jgi:hypothetical protein
MVQNKLTNKIIIIIKQNKTKQNKTKQNKTKQNKIKTNPHPEGGSFFSSVAALPRALVRTAVQHSTKGHGK